ncbi:hypothetical protein NDN08_006522 [Rhodosorus marinus]|uniref:SnoaL-like domain-containing protein n=1 Tax=Rhodosorus marinus TaxID=101924 RepID=A0AAV8UHU5_9RHOD|nr:hypothetical protein NDN08_006522 [Rhodosorus marinus]
MAGFVPTCFPHAQGSSTSLMCPRHRGPGFVHRQSTTLCSEPTGDLVRASEGLPERVRAFYDFFNRRDFDSMLSLLAEYVVIRDYRFSSSTRGLDNVREYYENLSNAYPEGAQVVLTDLTDGREGDAAAVFYVTDRNGKELQLSRGMSYHVEDELGMCNIEVHTEFLKPGKSAAPVVKRLFSFLSRIPADWLNKI